MTNSRLFSHAARLAALALLLGTASFAADPLQPNAVTQLTLLEPPAFVPSMRVGAFDLHPQISAGATYDDNIALSSGDTLADWIWTVTPRLSAVADNMAEGYGTLLTVEYAPSFVMFTQHTEDDSIDQDAHVAASWAGAKLSLGVDQRFTQTEGGVVEVGKRLRQREYITGVTARYKLGEKTSVDVDPRMQIDETQGLIGSWEYGVDGFVNRLITPKITGSVGGSLGYVDPSEGPIQTYQRALGRVNYALTGKVQLNASFGGEWREYHNDHSDTFTPVFGVGAAYHPFEGTTITLEGWRRDEISVSLTNQDYTVTGVALGIRQRVFQRFHINLTGSYDHRDYQSSGPATGSSRNDNIYLIRAGIGMSIARHWTVDVFYQYSDDSAHGNDTTGLPAEGYTDNQFGLLATWKL